MASTPPRPQSLLFSPPRDPLSASRQQNAGWGSTTPGTPVSPGSRFLQPLQPQSESRWRPAHSLAPTLPTESLLLKVGGGIPPAASQALTGLQDFNAPFAAEPRTSPPPPPAWQSPLPAAPLHHGLRVRQATAAALDRALTPAAMPASGACCSPAAAAARLGHRLWLRTRAARGRASGVPGTPQWFELSRIHSHLTLADAELRRGAGLASR